MVRKHMAAAVTAAAAALLLVVGPVSAAVAGGPRIGPNQLFQGLVNGKSVGAVIAVVCPGPGGETGRALPNQPLEVVPAITVGGSPGNTGSAGRAIIAVVAAGSLSAKIARFTSYGTEVMFPTNIPVPCEGTSAITFIPRPGSPTARSSVVQITWGNVATGG